MRDSERTAQRNGSGQTGREGNGIAISRRDNRFAERTIAIAQVIRRVGQFGHDKLSRRVSR